MAGSQVTLTNFPEDLSAFELAEFLRDRVGVVWRCKVKRTSVPAHAFMQFVSNEIERQAKKERLTRCCPHAFVHFACSEVAKEACHLAKNKYLVIRERALIARPWGSNIWSKPRVRTKGERVLQVQGAVVELGFLEDSTHVFSVSWRLPTDQVIFEVDPFNRHLRFVWTQLVSVSNGTRSVKCDYKMEFRLKDVKWAKHVECGQEGRCSGLALSLMLQFCVPPYIFYRTADDDIVHMTSFELGDDEDPWIRIVDCSPNNSVGRCLVYRVGVNARQISAFWSIYKYFQVHGPVTIGSPLQLTVSECSQYMPPSKSFFYSVEPQPDIPFDHLFLVNALVHRGVLQPLSLDHDFFSLLNPKLTSANVATLALRRMLAYRKPVLDAFNQLHRVIGWMSSQQGKGKADPLPQGSMLVRRLVITPTRAYCLAPEIELSNRVVRHYSHLADRFLRVAFHDDNMHPMLGAPMTATIAPIVRDVVKTVPMRSPLYWRIRDILHSGFELCGRKYGFLAFSASQLRDSCAWFFASDKQINQKTIREWMGKFPSHNVAKMAARMGQCFSSTYPTLEVIACEIEDLEDVVRNGYTFSDGVGKISPSFAKEISEMMLLQGEPPSAFQIRYAGYKGVVVQWPGASHKLSLRPSMKKFASDHRILEVVGWTRYLPSHLNRQIITLLSSLQVKNQIFIDLQDNMVNRLCKLLDDSDLALQILLTTCSGNSHNTAVTMLSGGFHPNSEPHLKEMLLSIRCMQLSELLGKAKIYVPKGRWLMGCLDETGLLQYGQCFLQVSSPSTGETGDGKMAEGSPRVITGKVIMAKNPCLHPGDIRVLQAVDIPGLRHLVDCLVVPQTGDRPHPNEASGSDLDGDVYFVSWDQNLVPPSGMSSEPMDYGGQEAVDLGRQVTMMDIQQFFAQHVVNDHLGVICNAHVVHSDLNEKGAMHENAIKLAKLAATAVDYPKTGRVAIMPQELRPLEYPDFMDKEGEKTYQSNKILGILYRKVKGFVAQELSNQQRWCTEVREDHIAKTIIYDPDLEVPGYETHLEDAWAHKCAYEQELRALMTRYDVKSEAEAVTGHMLSPSNMSSRRLGDLNDRMRYAFGGLRKEFRTVFEGSSTTDVPTNDEEPPKNEEPLEQEEPVRKRRDSGRRRGSQMGRNNAFLARTDAWAVKLREYRKENLSFNVRQQVPRSSDGMQPSPEPVKPSGQAIADVSQADDVDVSPEPVQRCGQTMGTVSQAGGADKSAVQDDKNTLEARASAWYRVTYHPDWMKKTKESDDYVLTGHCYLLSFPWIAADELAQVKARKVKPNTKAKVITKPVLIGKRAAAFSGASFLDNICA